MSDRVAEILSRRAIAVDDDTDPAFLAAEFGERLDALLASRFIEPTPDGWRTLALQLALQHEPAFAIETPVDRKGASGMEGRPVGFSNFAIRSMMKGAMKKGISAAAASRVVASAMSRWQGKRPSALAIANLMAKPPITADYMRRRRFEVMAERALKEAAVEASQEG